MNMTIKTPSIVNQRQTCDLNGIQSLQHGWHPRQITRRRCLRTFRKASDEMKSDQRYEGGHSINPGLQAHSRGKKSSTFTF